MFVISYPFRVNKNVVSFTISTKKSKKYNLGALIEIIKSAFLWWHRPLKFGSTGEMDLKIHIESIVGFCSDLRLSD